MRRPILTDEAALTVLPTGFVKIRQGQAEFKDALHQRNPNDPASERANIIFAHEAAHCIQAITTAFAFDHCERVRKLSANFTLWLSDPKRTREPIDVLHNTLKNIDDDLDRPSGVNPIDDEGVSPRQLMEATAVLESLQALDPNLTIDKLMNKLPTGDDTYSRVFGIMIRALSPRATLKLTQMLVYIALNNAQPGDAFCKMVYKLSNVLLSQLDAKSPGDILDCFMAQRENSLLDGFADNRRPSASPFWNEVGHAFATSGERRLMHLIAAYPSSLIAENNWSREVGPGVKEAAPLMFAFEDGTGRITNELPNNDVTTILTANELIGVMYKVGADKGYETLCRQMNCPSRGTHLCHMAYPVSPAEKWENCGFRARFKQISGMLPEEFDIWLKGGSGRPSSSKSILVMVAGALRNLAALLKSLFAST